MAIPSILRHSVARDAIAEGVLYIKVHDSLVRDIASAALGRKLNVSELGFDRLPTPVRGENGLQPYRDNGMAGGCGRILGEQAFRYLNRPDVNGLCGIGFGRRARAMATGIAAAGDPDGSDDQ